MKLLLKIYLILISLFLIQCAGIKKQSNRLYEKVLVSMRKPGEKILALPDKVWVDQNCVNKELPFLAINEFEISPKILRPGESINQRFVYTLCSDIQYSEIIGELSMRIHFRDKLIVNDIQKEYAMKPGLWSSDTFVDLPKSAKAGVYAIEIEFKSSNLNFIQQGNFFVEK